MTTRSTTATPPFAVPSALAVTRELFHKDRAEPELVLGWLALMGLVGANHALRADVAQLVDLFVMLLAGRWILTDPPADRDALWRSLPVRPGTLILAKLTTVLAAIVGPLVVAQIAVAVAAGFPASGLAPVLLHTAIYGTMLVLGAAAVAATCKDFPQFVVRGAAILIATRYAAGLLLWKVAIALRGSTALPLPRPSGYEAVTSLAAALLFAVAVGLAASRHRSRAWIACFALGLGTVFLVRPILWEMIPHTPRVDVPVDAGNAAPMMSLVNLRDVDPEMTRLGGWPAGVVAGIDLGRPSDTVAVMLNGLAGSLRLPAGGAVPVSRWLEQSRQHITAHVPGTGQPVRVVELLALSPGEFERVRSVPGRLELGVRYQIARRRVAPFDRAFRLRSVELRPDGRIEVETEVLDFAGSPAARAANFDLLLWNADRSAGYRVRQVGGSSESRQIGVLSQPELRAGLNRREFDLATAARLLDGAPAGDARREVTREWLADAHMEAWAMFWEPERERRITVPEFLVRDWWVEKGR